MEIEIVEFYRLRKVPGVILRGTIHCYLCDYLMDIRGIYIELDEKNRWNLKMPMKIAKDENGLEKMYPLIEFTDPKLGPSLKQMIKEKSIKYIKEKYPHHFS